MKLTTYNDTLTALRKINACKVLVVGPQRSGTTICAKMLALDLTYSFIREENYNSYDISRWFEIHNTLTSYVCQGTGLTYMCQLLPVDAVVFMWRDNQEIADSVERINWQPYMQKEMDLYNKAYFFPTPHRWKNSWTMKKDFWQDHQRYHIEHAFTVPFESLEDHPLFIPKAERTHFSPRQISK